MIAFDPLANKTYGDPDFSVNAAASSGLAVSFAASGSCTVSGARVHLTGVGSCTVTASQPGDRNYNPAPDVSRTFSIARATCRVPNVVGKRVASAKRTIAMRHCRTGKVRYAYSRKRKKGIVISQSRRPGRVLPAGSTIKLDRQSRAETLRESCAGSIPAASTAQLRRRDLAEAEVRTLPSGGKVNLVVSRGKKHNSPAGKRSAAAWIHDASDEWVLVHLGDISAGASPHRRGRPSDRPSGRSPARAASRTSPDRREAGHRGLRREGDRDVRATFGQRRLAPGHYLDTENALLAGGFLIGAPRFELGTSSPPD